MALCRTEDSAAYHFGNGAPCCLWDHERLAGKMRSGLLMLLASCSCFTVRPKRQRWTAAYRLAGSRRSCPVRPRGQSPHCRCRRRDQLLPGDGVRVGTGLFSRTSSGPSYRSAAQCGRRCVALLHGVGVGTADAGRLPGCPSGRPAGRPATRRRSAGRNLQLLPEHQCIQVCQAVQLCGSSAVVPNRANDAVQRVAGNHRVRCCLARTRRSRRSGAHDNLLG